MRLRKVIGSYAWISKPPRGHFAELALQDCYTSDWPILPEFDV